MSGFLMSPSRRAILAGAALLVSPMPSNAQTLPPDPLPSWRDGKAKQTITAFVHSVVTPGSPGFVPVAQRIAVFDNDGTLWVEEPVPAQGMFALDRLRAMAARDPSLGESPVYKNMLEKGPDAVASLNESDIADVLVRTHSGMTTEEFGHIAKEWLATARHPRVRRLYKDAVYQPQLELLAYLRANGFKTFLVSGGGTEFLRALAEEAYGIPPEQVVGSSGKTEFEMRDGRPVLVKRPEIGTVNDGAGKPANINLHVGRRPILAFGNADSDLPMLQWTAAGAGPHLVLLLHHDDAAREFAYDRQSLLARLDKGLEEAGRSGWTVVSMARDWNTVFPPAKDNGIR